MTRSENDWDLRMHHAAEKQLERMDAKDGRLLDKAIQALKKDPLSGDTHPLQGPDGRMRKRVGNWRIIFRIFPTAHIIVITDIERRTSTTY